MFLDQEYYPPSVTTPLLSLFQSLLHQDPTDDELEKIIQYLMASHNNSELVVAPSSILMRKGSEKKKLLSMTSGMFSRKSSGDDNIYIHQNFQPIRNGVIGILLNKISVIGENLIERLFTKLPLEKLLALIHHNSIEFRISLLKILDYYVYTNSLSILPKFLKLNGFNILAHQLKLHEVNEELINILFSLTMGKTIHLPVRKLQKNEQIQFNFVTVIVSISENCRLDDLQLWSSVIYRLSQLIVSQTEVQEILLKEGQLDAVCNLFLATRTEFSSKIAYEEDLNDSFSSERYSPPLSPVLSFKASQEFNGSGTQTPVQSSRPQSPQPSVQSDNLNRIESEILSLLKLIAVTGCRNKGFTVVEEIITSLQRLEGTKLSRFFIQSIQRAILQEILDYLNKTSKQDSEFLSTSFASVCSMAVDHIMWSEPVNANNSNSKENEEFRFIQHVFNCMKIFIQSSSEDSDSQLDYLPFFATCIAVRTQMGRLVLHLLSPKQNSTYKDFILIKLAENEKLLSPFFKETLFMSKLLYYVSFFLTRSESHIRNASNILLKRISSIKEVSKFAYSETPMIDNWSEFSPNLLREIASTEEKNESAERYWRSSRQDARGKREAQLRKLKRSLRVDCDMILKDAMAKQHQSRKMFFPAVSMAFETEKNIEKLWKILIKEVTHDCAVWSVKLPDRFVFQLDKTEGPQRKRCRLKRVNKDLLFNVPRRQGAGKAQPMAMKFKDEDSLSFLFQQASGTDQTSYLKDKTNEKLSDPTRCIRITPFSKRDGEFIVGTQNFYFIDSQVYLKTDAPVPKQRRDDGVPLNPNWKPPSARHITLPPDQIHKIYKRRNLLKDNAFEVFLTNGKTYLFAFDTKLDRDQTIEKMKAVGMPNRIDESDESYKSAQSEKWSKGLISNFEYLMYLNTLAGRTFNDLTQYPVFPFVIADYTSEELDLENPKTFRNLSMPMGAQDETRLEKFYQRYKMMKETDDSTLKPFYYGSHYSNMGMVLHFLVRLEPFTQYFLEFQDHRFDIPDRSFHSIKHTWNLSSALSTTDVKELIPEFYFFHEFLSNINECDMGVMQNGVSVEGVDLPPWAKGNPRLFVKKHLEALECKYVSENLHNWIDLIFGYKQRGEEAESAHNVFYHLTYEGEVNVDEIENEVDRAATVLQIASYGQTPTQIFKAKHPTRTQPKIPPLCNWNDSTSQLTVQWRKDSGAQIGSLDLVQNQLINIASGRILLKSDGNKSVSWDHWDQNLRISSDGRTISLIETFHDESIICCAASTSGSIVVTGGTSSTVKLWEISKEKKTDMKLKTVLCGHQDRVTCLSVSEEYSIITSGGGSRDRKFIVWDLNTSSFVISSERHVGALAHIIISTTTGEIATVSNHLENGEFKSRLGLFTINATKLFEVDTKERITCVKFTNAMEGANKNFILGGLETGSIMIWSTWDLSFVRRFDESTSPVVDLAISTDNSSFYSGHKNREILFWSKEKKKGTTNIPNVV